MPSKNLARHRKTRINTKLLVVFFALIPIGIIFGISEFYAGKRTSSQQAFPNINKGEIDRTTNDIREFSNTILQKYGDFKKEIGDETIQDVETNNSKSVWIVETIDNHYLSDGGMDSKAMPRHIYLVTDTYWKRILAENNNVECSVKDFHETTKTIIIQASDRCEREISLYTLVDGTSIPLTDPRNYIPKNAQNLLKTGTMIGLIPTKNENPIFEVSYGHSVTTARGFFDSLTGEMTAIIIF